MSGKEHSSAVNGLRMGETVEESRQRKTSQVIELEKALAEAEERLAAAIRIIERNYGAETGKLMIEAELRGRS